MSTATFDIAELEGKVECDISDVRLVDICRRDIPSEECQEEQITVVFFDLPNPLRLVLPCLSSIYKSNIFQNTWKRNSRSAFKEKQNNNLEEGVLSLVENQKNVWQPSIQSWEQLAKQVYDGSIPLGDIDRHFTLRGNLEKELEIMFSIFKKSRNVRLVSSKEVEMDWTVKKRLEQINKYRSLQKNMEATNIVWQFKEALGLKGDFEVVEQLRNQVLLCFNDNNYIII